MSLNIYVPRRSTGAMASDPAHAKPPRAAAPPPPAGSVMMMDEDEESPFAMFMAASPAMSLEGPEPTLAPTSPRSLLAARFASQQAPGMRFAKSVDLRFLRPADLAPQVGERSGAVLTALDGHMLTQAAAARRPGLACAAANVPQPQPRLPHRDALPAVHFGRSCGPALATPNVRHCTCRSHRVASLVWDALAGARRCCLDPRTRLLNPQSWRCSMPS